MSQDDGCPSRALESSALLSSLSLQLPAPSSPSSSSSLSPMQAPVLRLGPRLSLGAEDVSGFGNGRLLTKSRSISASSRIDSAMPRFPGPLLPTVRRLNSSPASSKVETREMGNGDAAPLATDSKTLFVSLVTDSPVASNSGSIVEAQAVVQDRGSVDMRPRHGNREVVEPRTPDYSTSLSSKGESATSWATSSGLTFASSEFTGAWRSRPRIEVHGNDSPPPKAQRVSVDDDLGSDYTKSSKFRARKESQASTFELSSRPRNGTAPGPPQRHSSASKLLADKSGGRSIRDGSSSSSRRRRLPQSESSKYMSDAWMSEVKQPMQTCTTSVEGSAFALDPSKTKPLKLPSSIGWPIGPNKSALNRMSLLLLLLIIIPWSIHSVAQHRELKLLKREMARLQAAACHIGRTQSSNDSKEVAEEDANVLWQASLIVGLVLLLYGSSLTRHGLAISHFIRRSRDKCTDEDVPISKHVAYLVDVLFSTHSYAKAMALLLATLLLIAFGGFSLYAVGDENLSDALWRSWTYVADSGNHADSAGLGPRIVSVSISIGGMLIFALMLGLVSDAISEKVDSLRKGKSEVIESNHTLILGWSDKLGSLLQQLSIANQSLGGGVVVVLAERDKEEMESDIAKLEFDFMGTSVICRSGSPLIMADLKKVSVSKARSIIVLAEVENADQSDARALRVVLSLTAVREGLRGHVVVELSDLDNEPLVKLVGGEVVETVVAHDVIGRLMIQCARQPGLAQIWEDILGFDKAEFYLKRWPVLDGMRFQDVLVSFPDAIPCGVKVAAEKGKIVLNPPDNYVLSPGDEILVIAEDDDTYAPASLPQLRRGSLPKVMEIPKYPEKILFCGWRRDIHDMIKVLDAFLPSGSELWIFSDVSTKEREKKLMEENCDEFPNLKLEHREGNPVIRRHLESLPLQSFDSILILADEQLEENVVVADSRSLATLLLIRDIQSKRLPLSASRVAQSRRSGFTHSAWIGEMQQASDKSIIISEILDSRTRHLVSVSQIGDYVLSNELVSMALAMVAEEKQINRVLEELFGEEGNELYIRSAEFYLYDQEELSFFEIMIRARQRKETMIGYRRSSQERAIINPPNKAAIQKWSIDDVFVVLADHSNPATTSTTKTWSMSSGPSVLR